MYMVMYYRKSYYKLIITFNNNIEHDKQIVNYTKKEGKHMAMSDDKLLVSILGRNMETYLPR